MTGHELLIAFGVPAMFGIAGAVVYFVVSRETRRFDREHGRHAH